MFFYNVILPIIITVVIGTPLAVYAGVVAGRILIFYQLKSECLEVISMYVGPYYSSEDVKISERNYEGRMTSLIDKLENLGHIKSAKSISNIYLQMSGELSSIETSFIWSESRRKDEPKNKVSGSSYNLWYKNIDLLKPSLSSLLKPNFKV